MGRWELESPLRGQGLGLKVGEGEAPLTSPAVIRPTGATTNPSTAAPAAPPQPSALIPRSDTHPSPSCRPRLRPPAAHPQPPCCLPSTLIPPSSFQLLIPFPALQLFSFHAPIPHALSTEHSPVHPTNRSQRVYMPSALPLIPSLFHRIGHRVGTRWEHLPQPHKCRSGQCCGSNQVPERAIVKWHARAT